MSRLVRINLGSGQRKFANFINIDINPRWEPDILADGAHLPMFGDNEVDMIVAHHNIEHMTLGKSQQCLAECHRILKPGGSLLVFVPNLEALTQAWMQGRISDYIFCVNLHGAYMDDEADIHRWSFTKKSLRQHIYGAAAWHYVIPFDWRQIPDADIAKDFWIQGAEAIK